jgi:undecaprenyl-diphosphatase
MNLFQALILGIVQGATEFLPVSSSGHLVLFPWLLGWNDPSNAWYLNAADGFQLAFDVVLHLGTACAILVYFRRDWLDLLQAVLRAAQDRSLASPKARLALLIVLGTIPAALAGYFLDDIVESAFSRPIAAAGFLLATAALLAASEWIGRRDRDLEHLAWLDALLVGIGQALALFPGISRSGATMAAGLARGIKRAPAARFSFLLATPIILGAGGFKVLDLMQTGGALSRVPVLITGFVAAGIVGYLCIHWLLRYLQNHRLYPFAIYCACAGIVCAMVALTGLR